MNRKEKIAEVKNLKKYFPILGGLLDRPIGWVKAVDGVDLFVYRGETLGVVGESGCGKTTLGRAVLRLDEPSEGEVYFEGENILLYDRKKLRKLRLGMQIIYQDPYSSLDPHQTLGNIIEEPLIVHRIANKSTRMDRVAELMKLVGLRPEHYKRYPHEFSGGQRQRIGIARVLGLNPKLIVCDEPVSALDVSIQAQIINLLEDLQEQLALTYIFISHDLKIVEHISNRIAVMYLGRLVELASKSDIYQSPFHPYTEALLSVVPIPDPELKRKRIIIEGDVPSAINPPAGCHFHTRCLHATNICKADPPPPWEEVTEGHWTRCWRVRQIRDI